LLELVKQRRRAFPARAREEIVRLDSGKPLTKRLDEAESRLSRVSWRPLPASAPRAHPEIVESGDVQAVVQDCGHYRIDFCFRQDQVAHHHVAVSAPGQGDPAAESETAWAWRR
jgi:hypothetical protein